MLKYTILLLCLLWLPLEAVFSCPYSVTTVGEIEHILKDTLPARIGLEEGAWVTIPRLDIPENIRVNTSVCMDITAVLPTQRRVRFTLTDVDEASSKHTHTISAMYEAWVKVPALKQSLPRETAIKAEYLSMIDLPWHRITPETIRNVETAIGKVAKNTLPAYQPLSERYLKESNLVMKNTPITIEYRQHNMVLTMEGVALDSGAYGAPIRVMNARNQMVLHATIEGPGLARIMRRF